MRHRWTKLVQGFEGDYDAVHRCQCGALRFMRKGGVRRYADNRGIPYYWKAPRCTRRGKRG